MADLPPPCYSREPPLLPQQPLLPLKNEVANVLCCRLTDAGIITMFSNSVTGVIRMSEVCRQHMNMTAAEIKDVAAAHVGSRIDVRVLHVDSVHNRLDLSIRRATPLASSPLARHALPEI